MTDTVNSSAIEVEPGVFESVALIDNGALGTRTVRFETGRVAKQAAGAVVAFPTVEQLEDAVFDMVVAGRVVDGDVAIMMVEAEATENVIALVRDGAQAPTETVVAEGLEAAKPFIARLCRAQQDLATLAAKPTEEFPLFPPYEADVYTVVEGTAKRELNDALSIAGKQEREEKIDEVKLAVLSSLASDFEGREKEIGAAFR